MANTIVIYGTVKKPEKLSSPSINNNLKNNMEKQQCNPIAYSPQTSKKYSEIRSSINSTEREIFDVLKRINVKGKDVLDFGCGDGRYSLRFSEMGARSVTGIDISPDFIAIAKKTASEKSNVKFLLVDGGNTQLPKGSFDLIFAYFVLHYFNDTDRAAKEIHRLLREKRDFIGTFPIAKVKEGSDNLYNTILPTRLGKQDFVIVHPFMQSEEQIRESFNRAHLTIVQWRVIDNPDAQVDPDYPHKDKVSSYETVLCHARK